jgi:hypothetical protein
MASSRDRRKLRRMLQEAGLSLPRVPPSKPPTKEPSPFFWKKIPAWVYLCIGALSIVITLLEGYPWLSIEEGGFLEPSNPYSKMFKATNSGYLPVTHLTAQCKGDTTIAGSVF